MPTVLPLLRRAKAEPQPLVKENTPVLVSGPGICCLSLKTVQSVLWDHQSPSWRHAFCFLTELCLPTGNQLQYVTGAQPRSLLLQTPLLPELSYPKHINRPDRSLGQCCPIELSVVMETLFQLCLHRPVVHTWLLKNWKVSRLPEKDLKCI